MMMGAVSNAGALDHYTGPPSQVTHLIHMPYKRRWQNAKFRGQDVALLGVDIIQTILSILSIWTQLQNHVRQ